MSYVPGLIIWNTGFDSPEVATTFPLWSITFQSKISAPELFSIISISTGKQPALGVALNEAEMGGNRILIVFLKVLLQVYPSFRAFTLMAVNSTSFRPA